MTAIIDGSGQTTGGLINAGTAQASTSGTAITFTGIPSTAKRVTLIFSAVQTSGTSLPLVQVGSGSFTTTGYSGSGGNVYGTNLTGVATSTAGFIVNDSGSVRSGIFIITNITGNTWVCSYSLGTSGGVSLYGGGTVSLGGTLDRVRATTVNGTDTFTAGSINIFWE